MPNISTDQDKEINYSPYFLKIPFKLFFDSFESYHRKRRMVEFLPAFDCGVEPMRQNTRGPSYAYTSINSGRFIHGPVGP